MSIVISIGSVSSYSILLETDLLSDGYCSRSEGSQLLIPWQAKLRSYIHQAFWVHSSALRNFIQCPVDIVPKQPIQELTI
jgi:hypothetical protein